MQTAGVSANDGVLAIAKFRGPLFFGDGPAGAIEVAHR